MLRHAKLSCVDQCFRFANADASDMVVDIWLFLWEDGIFAKQTNDARMNSGYHLFIFHIYVLSVRNQRVRTRTSSENALANPFYFRPTWLLESYSWDNPEIYSEFIERK